MDDMLTMSLFAQSKVIKACQRALCELGRSDIEVMYGTWGFDNFTVAHYIMPLNVTFIPLDMWIAFDHTATTTKISKIGANRKLLPIIWAHHDDHRYIGRPYTPFPRFSDKLSQRNAKGFGIIHWMTFPLDLYFKSHIKQVWANSKDEDLRVTLSDFTHKNWGIESPELNEYIRLWITKGPMFGRETGQFFLDLPNVNYSVVEFESFPDIISKAKERLAILRKIDRKTLRNPELFEYFEESEKFYINFFENRMHFENAYKLLMSNRKVEARSEMLKTDIRQVIEDYAKAIVKGPFTTGEKAIVYSMGTRLWPDYINLEQQLGISPVRYRFAKTKHDPLAQGAGMHTWYIDDSNELWIVYGEKELKTHVRENEDHIAFKEPMKLGLTSFAKNRLPSGKYEITVVSSDVEELSEITLLKGDQNLETVQYHKTNGSGKTIYRFDIHLKESESNYLRITPEKGEAKIYSMMIKPAL